MRVFHKIIVIFDPNEIRRFRKNPLRPILSLVEVDGVPMKVDLNDHIGFMCFIKGTFDQTALVVCRQLGIGAHSVVIDIGANVGTTSVPISKNLGCEVVAIEASAINASLLLDNVARHKLRVAVFPVCLVDPSVTPSHSWLELTVNPGNRGANSIHANWNPSLKRDSEPTLSFSIDTLLQDINLERIALIKLDVEGSESAVLNGSRLLMTLQVPILFEWRPDIMTKTGVANHSRILHILEASHSLYTIDATCEYLAVKPFEAWVPEADVLAVPKSKENHILERLNSPVT